MADKAAPKADPELSFAWESGGQPEGDVDSLFDDVDPESLEDFLDTDPGQSEPKKKPKKEPEESDDEEDDEGDPEDEDFTEDESDLDGDDDEDTEEDEDDGEFDDDEPDDSSDDLGELSDDTVVPGVPVPGGTEDVPLGELKKGYSRQKDYTQKTQRLAEEQRVEMGKVREQRELLDAKLAKVEEVFKELGPKAPDPSLRRTDPGEYAAQIAEYDAWQRRIAGVGGARDEISEERKQELIEWRNDQIAEARQKLNAAVPEWSDPEVANEDLKALGSFLREKWGFTEQELGGVTDHRLVLMARENMQLAAKQDAGKGKVRDKRKSRGKKLRGGGAESKRRGKVKSSGKRERSSADKALNESGSLKAGAALIGMDLDDDFFND